MGRRTPMWVLSAAAAVAATGAAALLAQGLDGPAPSSRPTIHERVDDVAAFRWPRDGRRTNPTNGGTDEPGDGTRSPLDPPPPEAPGPGGQAGGDPPSPGPTPRPGRPHTVHLPSTYRPDRDTDDEPPEWDRPLAPGVLWNPTPGLFLRQRVYDVVRNDGAFAAPPSDPAALEPVPETVEGTIERFAGRIRLEVTGTAPVPLPNPAPEFAARIVAGARPGDRLALDRAGMLFLVPGTEEGERDLQIDLAAEPTAFGGPIAGGVTVDEVPPARRPTLPDTLASAAGRVAARIGVSRRDPIDRILPVAADWFRRFEPGPLPSGVGENDYEALALGRVGLCRHRAYAFVVTLQGLGVPARFAISLRHAWAEVLVPGGAGNDVRWVWRRIDLGGAYGGPLPREEGIASHVPLLPDGLPWPHGATPTRADGDAAGGPRRAGAGVAGEATGDPDGGTGPTAPGGGTEPRPPAGDGAAGTAAGTAARTVVALERYPLDAVRGEAVRVAGRAEGAEAGTVVDWVLVGPSGVPAPVGRLAIGRDGRFDGILLVPADLPPGDYALHPVPPVP